VLAGKVPELKQTQARTPIVRNSRPPGGVKLPALTL
jgi:hypothetical protein